MKRGPGEHLLCTTAPPPQLHHLPICNKREVIKTKAESLSDYGMWQERAGEHKG